jgi:hypothetical protein
MEAVERIQPRNLARVPGAKSNAKPRAAVQGEFRTEVRPILDHLERLQHEFLPEALLTSACGFCRAPAALRTPVANLVACYDACPMCCEEAKRALRLVDRGISGKIVSGSFLPAQVISARNLATQSIHDRRERQRAVPRSFAVTPVLNSDGTVSFHPTTGSASTELRAGASGVSAGSGGMTMHEEPTRSPNVEPPQPRVRRCLELFVEWGTDRKITSPQLCGLYNKKFGSLPRDDPDQDSMEDNVFRRDMVPRLVTYGLMRGGKSGYWLPRDSAGFRLGSNPADNRSNPRKGNG